MKNYLKNFFKGWNAFEYVLLFVALTVPPTLGIVFKSSIFEILAATVASVVAIIFAKGKVEAYFLAFVSASLELVVAWQVGFYNTVIVIIATVYPALVFGIWSWVKNKRNDEKKGQVVKVSTIRWRELLLVAVVTPALWLGVFFMLRALGSQLYVLGAFLTVTSTLGLYFLVRRSRLSMFVWVVGDLIFISMWLLLLLQGHTGAVAILALGVMWLVTDFYGIYMWNKLKKAQEEKREIVNLPLSPQ